MNMPMMVAVGLVLIGAAFWIIASRDQPEPRVVRRVSCEEAAGMTVNEVLYVAGLTDEYWKAVADNDHEEVDRILEMVCLWKDDEGMHWPLPREDVSQ